MSWEKLTSWVKAHPWEASLISLGLLLLLLWLFGFFGSGSSSASTSGGQNLAAAYYAAEAAQTTAATQLQMATVAYGAQTAQTQIQATAAQGIASTQANMYTTLGQQGSDTQIALSHDNLLATQNSNDDALAAATQAGQLAYQTTVSNNNAAALHDVLTTVVPTEIAAGVTSGVYSTPAGGVTLALPSGSPAALQQAGYTPAQIASIWG